MTDIFQIIGRVSLEGIDKAERELNGLSDTGEKSSSKLSKLGGAVGKIGKGLLIGTGAVATAGVGLVKKVSASYGQLQQSIGGIETLFGKSAQKVIENANNAYTTAGISANDYMQQVTSFSASLLQSLGGDTEKACNYADTAVRDMADNANKMGTSMEMIQNAYQGFAKGNYTMLDNLKLGYGGTATEMARLINDSGVLGDQMIDLSDKQNIGNALAEVGYAKQIEAIHKIQEEMGITGTTALEAGGTIEGSFNSLSASWENFVAGLGNPDADMKVLVENLAKGINGAITNVIPVINNMVSVLPTVVSAITDGIKEMLPTLIQTFSDLITQIITAIVDLLPTAIPLILDCVLSVAEAIIQNLPQIIDAFLLLISELISKVSEMLPTLIPLIIDVIVQIAQSLIDNAPLILNALMSLLDNLVNALIDAIPTIIDALPTLIDGILNFLLNSMPVILDGAIKLFMAIVEALPQIITKLLTALPTIINTITSFLITAVPQLVEAAITLFMALVEALPTIIDALVNALPEIITSIVNYFTEYGAVFFDCAVQLFMALVEAIPTIVSSLLKALPKIITAIMKGLSGLPTKLKTFFKNIWSSIKNVFSGVGEFFKTVFHKAYTAIKIVWEPCSEFFSGLWSGVKNVFSNVGGWFKNKFNQGVENIKTVFSKVKDFFKGIWNGIKDIFGGVADWFGNVFDGAVKAVKAPINWCIDALNYMISALNSISFDVPDFVPGIGGKHFGLNIPEIPQLAKGGVVDEPTVAEIGEDGKEAIVPLENNTGWISGLAKTLMQELKSVLLPTLNDKPIENIVNQSPIEKYQVSFDMQFNALNDRVDKLINLIGNYLPNIADNMDREIILDSGMLAVGMSRKLDSELGRISTSKGRGNV